MHVRWICYLEFIPPGPSQTVCTWLIPCHDLRVALKWAEFATRAGAWADPMREDVGRVAARWVVVVHVLTQVDLSKVFVYECVPFQRFRLAGGFTLRAPRLEDSLEDRHCSASYSPQNGGKVRAMDWDSNRCIQYLLFCSLKFASPASKRHTSYLSPGCIPFSAEKTPSLGCSSRKAPSGYLERSVKRAHSINIISTAASSRTNSSSSPVVNRRRQLT